MASTGEVQTKASKDVALDDHGPSAHHKELEVVPIEEEAHQDAVHINLSWRSWVRLLLLLFSTYYQF